MRAYHSATASRAVHEIRSTEFARRSLGAHLVGILTLPAEYRRADVQRLGRRTDGQRNAGRYAPAPSM